MDLPDPDLLPRELSAFVDGELDLAATRRLVQHLSERPAAVEELRRLQQLTADARRAVRLGTPPPSHELMDRLRALAPTGDSLQPPMRLGQHRWLIGAARAAVVAGLLVGGGMVGGALLAHRPGTANTVRPPAPVIPAALVAHAARVHAECSRLALGLHDAKYPADLGGLADDVRHDLASANPYPDLRSIGFHYRGAGPCGDPLADTAHLLYRSVVPGSVAAVSVFVRPYHGQFALDTGRLYTLSSATDPFPMLAWRTDRVVYFLLADDAKTERAAAQLIRRVPIDQ